MGVKCCETCFVSEKSCRKHFSRKSKFCPHRGTLTCKIFWKMSSTKVFNHSTHLTISYLKIKLGRSSRISTFKCRVIQNKYWYRMDSTHNIWTDNNWTIYNGLKPIKTDSLIVPTTHEMWVLNFIQAQLFWNQYCLWNQFFYGETHKTSLEYLWQIEAIMAIFSNFEFLRKYFGLNFTLFHKTCVVSFQINANDIFLDSSETIFSQIWLS